MSIGYQSEYQNTCVVELEGNEIPNVQQKSFRRIAGVVVAVLAFAATSAVVWQNVSFSSTTDSSFNQEDSVSPKPKHNSLTNHHKQTHHRQNTKNNKKDQDNIHDDDANLAYNGKNGWPGNKNGPEDGDDESSEINRGIPPLNVSGPSTDAPPTEVLEVDPKPKHNSLTNHHKQTHHRQNTKNNKKDEDNIHDDDANLAYNGKNGWPGNKNGPEEGDDESSDINRGIPPLNVSGPSTDAPPTEALEVDPKPKHNSLTNHHKQTHHRQNTKNNKKDEDNIHDDDANLAYNGKNGWPGNKNGPEEGDDESSDINRGIPPLNVSGPSTDAPPTKVVLEESDDDELKNEEIEDDYILHENIDPKPKHNSLTNHHKQTHHRQNTKNNKKDEDNIHDDDANLAYNGKNGWPGNKNGPEEGDDESSDINRGIPPLNVSGPSTDAPPTSRR